MDVTVSTGVASARPSCNVSSYPYSFVCIVGRAGFYFWLFIILNCDCNMYSCFCCVLTNIIALNIWILYTLLILIANTHEYFLSNNKIREIEIEKNVIEKWEFTMCTSTHCPSFLGIYYSQLNNSRYIIYDLLYIYIFHMGNMLFEKIRVHSFCSNLYTSHLISNCLSLSFYN